MHVAMIKQTGSHIRNHPARIVLNVRIYNFKESGNWMATTGKCPIYEMIALWL